jgi:hypothetical protein
MVEVLAEASTQIRALADVDPIGLFVYQNIETRMSESLSQFLFDNRLQWIGRYEPHYELP